MKEIEDDTNKWKDVPFFFGLEKNQYCQNNCTI